LTAAIGSHAIINPQNYSARPAPVAIIPQHFVLRQAVRKRLLCRFQAFPASLVSPSRLGILVSSLAGRATRPAMVARSRDIRAAGNARHMMTVNAHAHMLSHPSSLFASRYMAERATLLFHHGLATVAAAAERPQVAH
jgi:hypothetical protein